MDKTMPGEAMASNVLHKINKLKFLYCKSDFLILGLRRLPCNAIILLHFDYACSAFHLIKKLKQRIQTTQNKHIRFHFQLDKLKHISHLQFEYLNWLS